MFEHQSDYSIALSASTVESWWRSHVVFKIHARTSSSSRSSSSSSPPSLVGIARLSLRYVLKSRHFKLAKRLAVKDASDTTRRIGTLHVSVELTSELNEFATGLARLRASESTNPKSRRSRHISPHRRSPAPSTNSIPPLPPPTTTNGTTRKDQLASIIANYEKHQKTNDTTNMMVVKSTKPAVVDDFNIPMHMFLSINEGKLNHQLTSNIYLICRLFWNKEKVRFESPKTTGGGGGGVSTTSSQFCWTLNLAFVLQRAIVENMRNNFMIIEAWRQSHTSNDSLVGMIKLPLHEFWLRFNEASAVRSFLDESTMPLIGVDGWLSAYDPFTGDKAGEINTQLALGSQQQVINLQKFLFDKARKITKLDEPVSSSRPKKVAISYLS